MKPTIWGRHGWLFMHSITMEYPDHPTTKDKKRMYIFFNSVKYLLPCQTCSHNFQKHLKKKPLTNKILSSRDNLVVWLIEIHNEVNKSTGKKVLSVKDALNSLNRLLHE